LERFRGTGAGFVESPAALGAASDLVGICVVDDAGVQEVLLGESGVLSGMSSGGIIAIHSTISLEVCHKVAAAAADAGVKVIDAPVSGGGYAATQGELTVLAGGDPQTFKSVSAILDHYGRVFHLGPLGSGLIAKLVNNVLHAAHYTLAYDALAAGVDLGLDREALGPALAASSGGSYALNAAVMVGGFDILAPMVGPLLRKDVNIFGALAAEHHVSAGSLVTTADKALSRFGYGRNE
jgi:3-hydroxyisobutyrate dehydrogenase-like beta-hydroxyacid dehydrogenase